MTTKYLGAGAVGALLLAFGLTASAQTQATTTEATITFPIAELGNCGSKEACKTYCNDSAHMEACVAFAEKNNLMPKDEIDTAKKFIAAGAKGPGGCTGKDSCEAYCNDTSHIDACITFAEQAGMMSPSQLSEAKKVQAAIKNGIQPPPCGGKKACDAYCRSPENMPACITFAKQAGLMSPEDAANADKMLEAIKSGVKPPACQGREECNKYCAEDTHVDECADFGKAAGFISAQQAEIAKKTRGKGPGGCMGEEACQTFCQDPANQQTCFEFGKANGLIPAEDLQKMEEGNKQFKNSISNAPPEVASCLKNALGADADKIMNGTLQPTREAGDKMKTCFEQQASQSREPKIPRAPVNSSRGVSAEGQSGQPPFEGKYGGQPPKEQEEHYGPRPPEGTYRSGPEGSMPPAQMMPQEDQWSQGGSQSFEENQIPAPPGGKQVPTPPAGVPGMPVAPGSAPAAQTAPASTPTPTPTTAPTPTPTPASAPTAPAPAPAPKPSTSLLSPTSLTAAAINFFKSLFRR